MKGRKKLKRIEHTVMLAALCIVGCLVGVYAYGFTSPDGQAMRLRQYLEEGRDICNIPGISERVRKEYIKEQLGDVCLKDVAREDMVHLDETSDWSRLSGGYRIGRIAKERFRPVWGNAGEQNGPWYRMEDKLFYKMADGFHYVTILPYGMRDAKQTDAQIIVRKDNRKPIGQDLKDNVEVIFKYYPETDTMEKVENRCAAQK